MKDANGRIGIGLPVSGNLDDPQFSYGHLMWKGLISFFTKIVPSPFRALLAPPEREKVKTLSEVSLHPGDVTGMEEGVHHSGSHLS